MKFYLLILLFLFAKMNLYSINETYNLKLVYDFNKNPSVSIYNLDSFDSDNCIILHSDSKGTGMISEKTTDGGKTWQLIFADSSTKNPDYFAKNIPRYCKYFSNGTIILLGEYGKLIRSEDFGETFIEYQLENYFYSDFVMLDNKRAVTTTIKFSGIPDSHYGTYKSTDGCKTWQDFNIPDSIKSKYNFRNINVQKNKDLIISYSAKYPDNLDSTKRFYYKTDFDGSFWLPIETPSNIDKLYFINSNEVLGTGKLFRQNFQERDTAIALKSYDGGKTWEIKIKSISPNNSFTSTDYYYDSLITTYGFGFGFFKTTDVGESWFMPVFNKDTAINDMIFSTASVRLLENDNLFILTRWPEQVIKGTKVQSSVSEPSVKPYKIYPNPVTQGTDFTSEYEIENSGQIKIYISDISGKEVNTLYTGFTDKGFYSTQFKLPDYISSGCYWLNTEMNGFRHVQMLNVVR